MPGAVWEAPQVPDVDLLMRVGAARVARLATIDPDGRAHLVPICFALEGEVLYSAVDQKRKRSRELRRLRNMRERPWASVLVDHYEEDWSRLWWVLLRGPARVLEPGGESRRALAVLAEKYPQYRREPPEGPVFALSVTEWRVWEASPAQLARQNG
jgi:PPOX class probable F420-dependent enzyme